MTRPLNITIISHSDIIGGAAVATMRLMQTLESRGHNVRMFVFTKFIDSDKIINVGTRPTVRLLKFGMERLRILLGSRFRRSDLFKVSTADTGIPVADYTEVQQADIVILGWINQGLLSLEEIQRIHDTGKPIIQVMHDMWNLTGACHHPYECTRYEQMCGYCPFFGGRSERDLSRRTWWRKKHLYERTDIDFVAVSDYVADKAARSQLLAGHRIHVIHNTFNPDIFEPGRARNNPYGLPRDKHIITMSAARLDNPIKGLDIAVDAFNRLFDSDPGLTNRCEAVFIGDIRDPDALNELRFPYRVIGVVHELTALADIYAMSDVILSTSLYETFGLTLLEGLASGATPVTFGRGGQGDIVRHKSNGYIARYRDPDDIARGIRWAIATRLDRQAQHTDAVNRFAPDIMADSYEALFDDIFARRARPATPPASLDALDRQFRDAVKDFI